MKSAKVFCIGSNKTGTSSMAELLRALGFTIGSQPAAELLIEDWARRDFRRIVEYCRTADAFQDIPFSLPYTFQAVDVAFPGSKFILTVRSNSDEWFDSLVRFHSQGINQGRLPTPGTLKSRHYHYPGYLWRAQELIFGIDETTLYQRRLYVAHYERHIASIRDYFLHRGGDLLEVNVADEDSVARICRHLGENVVPLSMPHLNASR